MAFIRDKHIHFLLLQVSLRFVTSLTEGQIRLVGSGSSRCSGRVEIYHNSQWGTVCNDNWDLPDVNVVCRQLDCGTALEVPRGAHFGRGSDPIWLDEVGCSGEESSLSQCSHNGFGTHDCNHGEDAGVVCSGQIRLVGPDTCSGRVEIYHNSRWGTVCDGNWDLSDAEVVCRQLDCGTALQAPGNAHFGQGSDPIWLDEVGCSGGESSLSQCSHNGFGTHDCNHGEDAGVVCSGQIRLVGPDSCSGRVEIYHNSRWGTVCSDQWDLSDAKVVCRRLDCGTALQAPGNAHFGRGSGPIWLDDVDCSGGESSLFQCSHNGFGTHNCNHGEDAGVVCSVIFAKPSILINSQNVTWGKSVRVSCSINSELSGGTFTLKHQSRDVHTSPSNPATFNISPVTFDDEGHYYCLYQKELSGRSFSSPQSDSVTLVVSAVLPEPSLCVSSAAGGQQCSLDIVHFSRGQAFELFCSVRSDVPEGHFVLIFSGSNSSIIQPAVNHSASFHFPESQSEHQGEYHCVYEVTGAGRNYTAETRPIKIIVSLPLLMLLVAPVFGGLLLIGLVLLLLFLLRKKRSQQEQLRLNLHTLRSSQPVY